MLEKLPLASFAATILGCFDNCKYVSGSIFTPVLDGTLYKIIGRETLSAILL